MLQDGQVYCWGRNNVGQLGDGTQTNSPTVPVQVSGIDNAIGVAAGEWHTCAFTSADEIKCWGYGGFGQVGTGASGSDAIFTTPQTVTLPTE